MKIYMLKMTRLDGEHAYRASGVYDKWTQAGKCWSGGSFKSFLNYSKLIVENLLRDSERYNIKVVQIDLKQHKIEEIPFVCWYSANMKKVGDV
ncbi:MAG: hypothetical protein RR623_00425 [Bacilli bacterium]